MKHNKESIEQKTFELEISQFKVIKIKTWKVIKEQCEGNQSKENIDKETECEYSNFVSSSAFILTILNKFKCGFTPILLENLLLL